jgi:hypothetical protein
MAAATPHLGTVPEDVEEVLLFVQASRPTPLDAPKPLSEVLTLTEWLDTLPITKLLPKPIPLPPAVIL